MIKEKSKNNNELTAFFEGSKQGYDEGYEQAWKDCVEWLEGKMEPTLARDLRSSKPALAQGRQQEKL